MHAVCMFSGLNTGQCQRYEAYPGMTGSRFWWELLTTPVASKVNRAVDPGSCDNLARAEVLNFAWNQSVDLADTRATFSWEVDNDCAGPTVNLFNDAVVLGGVTGPYGAVQGGSIPSGMGYPLFAPVGRCNISLAPCTTSSDCSPSSQTCVYQGAVQTNGIFGNNRVGRNSCYFNPIATANQPLVHVAAPRDDDLDNDNDGVIDENVAINGPLRNMDITRAGGPDLVNETLEDRIGDTGDCFQAAFGMRVSEGTPFNPAIAGFGVTIDDVVLEWREVTYVPDTTNCTPGEAKILTMANNGAGAVTIVFAPACASTDHAVYWGPCSSPSSYTGAVCSVGTGPATVNPGGVGCHALVVVGHKAGTEGSYGRDSNNNERPEDSGFCGLAQNLNASCN